LSADYSSREARPNFSRVGAATSTSDAFGGRVCEIVVVDRALDSADTYLIENDMGAEYGITIT
jgi:hypothetical protein